MKENLKTTHYADGTPLVNGTGAGDITGDLNTKYWFVYGDNTANKNAYGLLYTWAAAMNGAASSDENPSIVQGVCPTGWHLPSDAEWKELEIHLGMSQADADKTLGRGTDEGSKLKETGTVHWNSPNTATNESGFTALGGGIRGRNGTSVYMGEQTDFWSCTEEIVSTEAWVRRLDNDYGGISRFGGLKEIGFSVRCVKDE
jgi:uncharacterized protein (TIGR02145 family)